MLNIYFLIKNLRRFAFLLFLVPTIGLLGSLLFNNILVKYDYTYHGYEDNQRYPSLNTCNKENNYCMTFNMVKAKKLDDCPKFTREDREVTMDGKDIKLEDYTSKYFVYKEGVYFLKEEFKKYFQKTVIKRKIYETNIINEGCIKNSNYYNIYKKIPIIFNFLSNLKINDKYVPGTSDVVYPFLYGESSISNIVKRFPINYLFKPLLYISSILMIMYWLYYQRIFNLIKKEQKIKKFFIFGILSSVFLFIHVFFLGVETENSILIKLRKLIILLFILCELAAQFFLAKRIYLSRSLISSLTFKTIIYVKVFFVSIIILISLIITAVLAVYNLPGYVDYFLEWNYFLILLIFYLLSSVMWKLPTTHQ